MRDIRSKKILFAITKSNWGGAQSYVYTLAKHCREQGADVAVAFGGTGKRGADMGRLAERLTDVGVRVIPVTSFMRDISITQELRSFSELLSIIRNEHPDVLHLSSSKAGGIGALAGRLAGVRRIIFTAHGWAHREPRGAFAKILIWISSWATVILSHVVIAVSELDRKTAPVLFSHRKIQLVYNGVSDFQLDSRSEARKFLARGNEELAKYRSWVAMNSELTKNKAVDIAIQSFADVGAVLVVMSEGEERERLRRLIESSGLTNKVFLLGFVPDAKRYLLAADIFLMPSRKEGLPLALLEAGQAALPVIATRVGGIPEIIEDGKNGLLIAPNNVAGLANSIDRLLKNPEEARSFGENLQATVREKFSEEKMLTQTIALY